VATAQRLRVRSASYSVSSRPRALGYAKIFETYEAGTSATAVPIFGVGSQRPIGTVSVAGPVIRMTSEVMVRLLPELREAATAIAEVSQDLPIFAEAVS